MALDEFGNVIPDVTEGATPVVPEATTDQPVSALAAPDLTTKYEQAATDIATAPPAIDAGYESPFVTDTATGALSGVPTAPKAETYYQDSPEITVAGQLEKLLAKDSPLSRVTEAKAKERATALGMESSSMAIGAAQKALIETATPIAAQDAKTLAAFKQSEQALVQEQVKIETEAQVAGELTLQKAKLQEQQLKINQQWESTMKGLDADTSAGLAEFQNTLNKDMEALKSNLTKELYQQQVDATVQEQIMNQSQDMLNNYQITVQQLLGNQVFLDSMPNQASMHSLFNDMFTTVSSSIKFASKASGVYDSGMQSAIDEMIADNRWS